MTGIWTRAVAMTLLLVPCVGTAGWFGGSDAKSTALPSASSSSNMVKRLHLKVKDAGAEKDLVLARIVQEKDVALGRINESMRTKFSMSRDMNYWYDPKEKSLYEVITPSTQGDVQ